MQSRFKWRLPAGIFVFALAILVATTLSVANAGHTDARQAPPAPPGLEQLKDRLLPLFDTDGVIFTDADERTGRLVIGVENKGLETSIRARLGALGVPDNLVDVVQSEPILRVDSLQDKVRPVEAGLQINFSNYLCSIGFNAVRNGVAGFVTASHCTDTQGGVEGTQYYQQLSPTYGGINTFIGTEVADPSYTGCGFGRVCRYSDSSFAAYASTFVSGTDYNPGKIEKTTGKNTGSQIIDSTSSFTVTAKAEKDSVKIGDLVDKVGRTTGWTEGQVSQTCVDTGVSGTRIVLRCQTWVTSSSVIVLGGDSGSGIFIPGQNDNVTLAGILWGGNSDGTTLVFSPINQVEDELGPLDVGTASGSPSPTPTATSTTAANSPTPTATSTTAANSPTPTATASTTPTPNSCPPGQHKKGVC